jgi:hypothetical protein
VFEWLESSAYADGVRESWGWPIALSIHAFGVATVIGLMAIIGLRLLGGFRAIPFTWLTRLVPLLWIALIAQVISGFTLWMTKPGKYMEDFVFDTKMTLVVIGALLTWSFQVTLRNEALAWEKAGTVSSRGVQFVALTALVWAAVTVAGRLTAYLSTLYIA